MRVFLHFSCVLTTWLIALFRGSISVRWGEDAVLLTALAGRAQAGWRLTPSALTDA